MRPISRALVLVSDAYGGRGGIALYNRHFLRALCSYQGMKEVIALPRSITYELEQMPENLAYRTQSAGGKLKYLIHCIKSTLFDKRVDLIICGHLHLLPFAWVFGLRHRCPVVPIIYGVEAWTPTSHFMVNRLCRWTKVFISIRHLTASRFVQWAGLAEPVQYYLPNCITETQYRVQPKRSDLVSKFSLQGKKVILTMGRMDSIEFDRRKGFDEVLEALPRIRELVPEVNYLIVGDGDDRERLRQKALALGVDDIVKFTGYISTEDKPDYYRLADVFAMPGSNPIFDRYPYRFVFLEAIACGVPVVGSKLEDQLEAEDPDARELIIQVDPDNKEEILRGVLFALNRGNKVSGAVLAKYFFSAYQSKLHSIITDICTGHI
jgi:phosphatidylinositol alpha-1,6-mannosyltransferase